MTELCGLKSPGGEEGEAVRPGRKEGSLLAARGKRKRKGRRPLLRVQPYGGAVGPGTKVTFHWKPERIFPP